MPNLYTQKNNAVNNESKSAVKAKSLTGDFDKQGHRGCRGLMPENTIPAMLNAIAPQEPWIALAFLQSLAKCPLILIFIHVTEIALPGG